MFRIDRRFVNVSGIKINKLDTKDDPEVGADGEIPDAAASMENIYSGEDTYSAEDAVNEYLAATKSETESKMEEILNSARQQAAKIISDAQDEAEEERRLGYEQGFEEGSAKGSEEGKSKYDEMIEAKKREDDETLKRVIDEMYEERERTYIGMEKEATNLSIEIVRKILNPTEDELVDVFTPMIKNALRQMPTDSKIVLRVGPKEYERFFSSGAAVIELDSGATVKASVLRDVSLNDGDLIIDTDDVTINAGLDSQLQYVELAFERANQYEPE